GYADHDRLDVADGLENLLVERCGLDLAAAAGGGKHRILTEPRDQMQAALDQVLEGDAIVRRDCGKPPVHHLLTRFRIDEKRWSLLGHCAEPIATQHMRGT